MEEPSTYIGPKGYTILKECLDNNEIKTIKKELTVKPFVPKSSMIRPTAFPIFRESKKKIYMPRFYGLKHYGKPEEMRVDNGEPIDVPFNGEVRDYQVPMIDAFINSKNGCGLLEIPCGRGKCLGYNTPILMYDGTIKKVQHIKKGDIIMGDDFKCRLVYSTTTGTDLLYEITQTNGITYVVNKEHILTLFDKKTNKLVDIEMKDYLTFSEEKKKELKGVKVSKDEQDNILYTLSDINVFKKRTGYYYGFEISGNRRFLLGDKTVTHNTVMALKIISIIKQKTLVIVHKTFLMNQWIERIKQFLPTASIGTIQGPRIDTENKDIVIGMLQSLSMKDYPQELFKQFGLTIIDECHHIAAEVFCRSLFKIVSKHMLGLSATMNRKDGLTKVFKLFLDDVVYSEKRKAGDNVIVRSYNYNIDDPDFNKVVYNFKGQVHYAIMIRKLCEFNRRTEFILEVLVNTLKEFPEQQLMILAHNKSLLHYLHDAIEHRNISTVGYYVGGMKEKDLKESESKRVIIATYAMAEEALDIKSLSMLIMATPKSDVTQAVGRILREKHKQPLVIDIVDTHDIFKRQWTKRRRFYNKCKYEIEVYNNHKKLKTTDKKPKKSKLASSQFQFI